MTTPPALVESVVVDGLDYALFHHGVGNLHEAGDVGAFHVVEVAVGFNAEGNALFVD